MRRAWGPLSAVLATQAMAEPKFEDHTASLPPHTYQGDWHHFVGGGLAVFDCNGDSLPDVFAAGGSAPATLLRNDGGFRFSTAPLPTLTGVTGAYPIDINADGLLDLFVLRGGPNVALQGKGDCTFEHATARWGLPPQDQWSTAFTAWWEDDPRPVMAIGNYVDRTDPDGPFEACDSNVILRPEGEGYRAEKLEPGFCALSILAAKDASGQSRLRLSNDRHYYVSGGHEQMWDIATRRFLGPEDGWQNVSLWGMGIASRDLTGDGRDEVMLTSMGDQLLQIASLDGTYTSAPFSIGTYAQRPHVGGDGRPSTGWHAEFGDIDNDGRADLFIAKGNVDQMPGMATRDPNNLLMQQPDGTFQEKAAEAGVADPERSRGAALVDVDLDGRLDLIVSNRRAPLMLYRNVTQNTGNWLRIDLRQAGGNRHAIGASITVTTVQHSQTLQRIIGGGHAGGQLLPLHIGLGTAPAADITVTWPDGTGTTHNTPANQNLLLQKP